MGEAREQLLFPKKWIWCTFGIFGLFTYQEWAGGTFWRGWMGLPPSAIVPSLHSTAALSITANFGSSSRSRSLKKCVPRKLHRNALQISRCAALTTLFRPHSDGTKPQNRVWFGFQLKFTLFVFAAQLLCIVWSWRISLWRMTYFTEIVH